MKYDGKKYKVYFSPPSYLREVTFKWRTGDVYTAHWSREGSGSLSTTWREHIITSCIERGEFVLDEAYAVKQIIKYYEVS